MKDRLLQPHRHERAAQPFAGAGTEACPCEYEYVMTLSLQDAILGFIRIYFNDYFYNSFRIFGKSNIFI